MLDVTKLLCETYETDQKAPHKSIGENTPSPSRARDLHFATEKRPVIVWNITKRCNLRCRHCYSNSLDRDYSGELPTGEALSVIDDLAAFSIPVIIFSGGEPLMREDIFDLAGYAASRGIRCVLSSNGVLINSEMARKIKAAGFVYIGVSIDGIGEINDWFRGMRGAYQDALTGVRNLHHEGLSTGLRLTLTKTTLPHLPSIFNLAEEEDIPRMYLSHLVYSGRGKGIKSDDLSHDETRRAVEFIFNKAEDFHKRGLRKDILTGSNDTDGVYLYLRVLSQEPLRAGMIYRLLRLRGGNSSGVAIGCIDYTGEVHADQFWSHYSFGNVLNRSFGEIWMDTNDPVMRRLKEKAKWVKGRCRLCRFLEICGGNYRVRAEVDCGDIWAEDPACYLTDKEIGINPDQ